MKTLINKPFQKEIWPNLSQNNVRELSQNILVHISDSLWKELSGQIRMRFKQTLAEKLKKELKGE
jgi:hypothetical protein